MFVQPHELFRELIVANDWRHPERPQTKTKQLWINYIIQMERSIHQPRNNESSGGELSHSRRISCLIYSFIKLLFREHATRIRLTKALKLCLPVNCKQIRTESLIDLVLNCHSIPLFNIVALLGEILLGNCYVEALPHFAR